MAPFLADGQVCLRFEPPGQRSLCKGLSSAKILIYCATIQTGFLLTWSNLYAPWDTYLRRMRDRAFTCTYSCGAEQAMEQDRSVYMCTWRSKAHIYIFICSADGAMEHYITGELSRSRWISQWGAAVLGCNGYLMTGTWTVTGTESYPNLDFIVPRMAFLGWHSRGGAPTFAPPHPRYSLQRLVAHIGAILIWQEWNPVPPMLVATADWRCTTSTSSFPDMLPGKQSLLWPRVVPDGPMAITPKGMPIEEEHEAVPTFLLFQALFWMAIRWSLHALSLSLIHI